MPQLAEPAPDLPLDAALQGAYRPMHRVLPVFLHGLRLTTESQQGPLRLSRLDFCHCCLVLGLLQLQPVLRQRHRAGRGRRLPVRLVKANLLVSDRDIGETVLARDVLTAFREKVHLLNFELAIVDYVR